MRKLTEGFSLRGVLRSLRRSDALLPFFWPYYRIAVWLLLRKTPSTSDPFLEQANGLIHVGAHYGEERLEYAKRKLRVLWIEANPEHIPILKANLRGVPMQSCMQSLLGSKSCSNRKFFVANNEGASSSIYPFQEQSLIWPDLKMSGSKTLRQFTLPEALAGSSKRIEDYDTLIMDVQGAELEILKGIPNLEQRFKRIQLETSDFPLYQGAAIQSEIDSFLQYSGYRLLESKTFATDGIKRNCMDCRYVLDR
jgi:FkbM family methyltransferase